MTAAINQHSTTVYGSTADAFDAVSSNTDTQKKFIKIFIPIFQGLSKMYESIPEQAELAQNFWDFAEMLNDTKAFLSGTAIFMKIYNVVDSGERAKLLNASREKKFKEAFLFIALTFETVGYAGKILAKGFVKVILVGNLPILDLVKNIFFGLAFGFSWYEARKARLKAEGEKLKVQNVVQSWQVEANTQAERDRLKAELAGDNADFTAVQFVEALRVQYKTQTRDPYSDEEKAEAKRWLAILKEPKDVNDEAVATEILTNFFNTKICEEVISKLTEKMNARESRQGFVGELATHQAALNQVLAQISALAPEDDTFALEAERDRLLELIDTEKTNFDDLITDKNDTLAGIELALEEERADRVALLTEKNLLKAEVKFLKKVVLNYKEEAESIHIKQGETVIRLQDAIQDIKDNGIKRATWYAGRKIEQLNARIANFDKAITTSKWKEWTEIGKGVLMTVGTAIRAAAVAYPILLSNPVFLSVSAMAVIANTIAFISTLYGRSYHQQRIPSIDWLNPAAV